MIDFNMNKMFKKNMFSIKKNKLPTFFSKQKPNRVLKNFSMKKFGGRNDLDFDGVPNWKDCQPRNTMRQDAVGKQLNKYLHRERPVLREKRSWFAAAIPGFDQRQLRGNIDGFKNHNYEDDYDKTDIYEKAFDFLYQDKYLRSQEVKPIHEKHQKPNEISIFNNELKNFNKKKIVALTPRKSRGELSVMDPKERQYRKYPRYTKESIQESFNKMNEPKRSESDKFFAKRQFLVESEGRKQLKKGIKDTGIYFGVDVHYNEDRQETATQDMDDNIFKTIAETNEDSGIRNPAWAKNPVKMRSPEEIMLVERPKSEEDQHKYYSHLTQNLKSTFAEPHPHTQLSKYFGGDEKERIRKGLKDLENKKFKKKDLKHGLKREYGKNWNKNPQLDFPEIKKEIKEAASENEFEYQKMYEDKDNDGLIAVADYNDNIAIDTHGKNPSGAHYGENNKDKTPQESRSLSNLEFYDKALRELYAREGGEESETEKKLHEHIANLRDLDHDWRKNDANRPKIIKEKQKISDELDKLYVDKDQDGIIAAADNDDNNPKNPSGLHFGETNRFPNIQNLIPQQPSLLNPIFNRSLKAPFEADVLFPQRTVNTPGEKSTGLFAPDKSEAEIKIGMDFNNEVDYETSQNYKI